jgi:trk system potassium uptake protein TrkA
LADHEEILLIGLGRFGQALARTLTELGHEVLAVDASAKVCQTCAGTLAQVVQADATSVEALHQIGAREFRTAVVAIGNDIQASIMATASLKDLGVKRIWAKAITAQHGTILERVGADHVVFPERDMGVRVAHTMVGRTVDYVELDENFVLIETTVPREMAGRVISELAVRQRYEITVLCVKEPNGSFTYATQDTRLNEGDLMVVFGERRKAERFADLP